MIQLINVRLVFFTILALGSAFLFDTKNSGARPHLRSNTTTSNNFVPNGLAASDWSSIRAAYEAGRHAAFPVDGGYGFLNPGQQWNTQFDGRGFLVQPQEANWSWGLELKSYGVSGRERAISSVATVKANSQRVDYNWDANLTEWYKNDSRGLEHGYTMNSRPANSNGTLTFNLTVRGSLFPRVQNNGRDIAFIDSSNASILNYSGLTVVDADGKSLQARFESTNSDLRLFVNDTGAHYPITIDPIAQQAYLKASNPGMSTSFGWVVAASGDTVVVGSIGEKSNATGVNGNQSDTSFISAGAAYVFVRSGTTWSQQAYLKPSNTDTGDFFGKSVSISGDILVVGAPNEDSNATGINGDQSNNSNSGSGAAYVFVRNGVTWTQQAYLKASNSETSDDFGSAVAVSGETVIVGAPAEDSSASGVNGSQSNGLSGSGAAYIFQRSGATWSQQAYLKASNPDVGDFFGGTVAISGDTVVVGSIGETSNATGVNGNQSDNSLLEAGAAYVFVRSGGMWSQQAYLKASNTNTGDRFTNSLAISGDTIVVGANKEDSNAFIINGNQLNNTGFDSGAAYVFVRSGGIWFQQAYLKASNSGIDDWFGYTVAISGNMIVVGAHREDSNSSGVNGVQTNNTGTNSGAAYVFERLGGTTWSQIAYLKASNNDAPDAFSWSVAVSGGTVYVGSPGEASNSPGVNGNQSNNSMINAGAVYVFDLANNPGTGSFGTGTPGCTGTETLGVNHAPMINSPHFALTCDNAPPLSMGLGIVTDSPDVPGTDAFGVGVLIHCDFVLATEILTFDFFSDATGYSETVGLTIPNNPNIVGQTYYACALWAWPTSTCILPGFNPYNLSTSRGLAITIQVP